MKSSKRLDFQVFSELLQLENIDDASLADIAQLFRSEISGPGQLPEKYYHADPRTGELIVYHVARSKRIHDNVPDAEQAMPDAPCVVCEGRTTGAVDVVQLSQGFSFINKNLFPVLYPFEDNESMSGTRDESVKGLHFLQWTSSYHDLDWRSIPKDDAIKVMGRLAALEKKLLDESMDGQGGDERYVLIFKNYGYLVGGSLAHGHQQIALSSIMPQRFRNDERFQERMGKRFSEYMLEKSPRELVVRDYGAATLVVPFFMRRPYDMMLLLKDSAKRYLHELSGIELAAVAEAWQDGTRAIHAVMPQIGREVAYNVVTHNGPGAGLYFEFLPYTQEIGGFEHLGLIVCQESPERAAAHLSETLDITTGV